jgi:hypothetical protein
VAVSSSAGDGMRAKRYNPPSPADRRRIGWHDESNRGESPAALIARAASLVTSSPVIPRAAVSGAIVSILAPYIGETMARASVDAQLEKLGVTNETLTAAQLASLIEKLGQGLNVFLGRSRANELVASMKALAPVGGLR